MLKAGGGGGVVAGAGTQTQNCRLKAEPEINTGKSYDKKVTRETASEIVWCQL